MYNKPEEAAIDSRLVQNDGIFLIVTSVRRDGGNWIDTCPKGNIHLKIACDSHELNDSPFTLSPTKCISTTLAFILRRSVKRSTLRRQATKLSMQSRRAHIELKQSYAIPSLSLVSPALKSFNTSTRLPSGNIRHKNATKRNRQSVT